MIAGMGSGDGYRLVKLGLCAVVVACPLVASAPAAAAKIKADDVVGSTLVGSSVQIPFDAYGGGYLSCLPQQRVLTGGAFWNTTNQAPQPGVADQGYLANSTATDDGKGWYADGYHRSDAGPLSFTESVRCVPKERLSRGKLSQKTVPCGRFPEARRACQVPEGHTRLHGGCLPPRQGRGAIADRHRRLPDQCVVSNREPQGLVRQQRWRRPAELASDSPRLVPADGRIWPGRGSDPNADCRLQPGRRRLHRLPGRHRRAHRWRLLAATRKGCRAVDRGGNHLGIELQLRRAQLVCGRPERRRRSQADHHRPLRRFVERASVCPRSIRDPWARLVSDQRPLACEAVIPQARIGVDFRPRMPADVRGCRRTWAPERQLVPNAWWTWPRSRPLDVDIPLP